MKTILSKRLTRVCKSCEKKIQVWCQKVEDLASADDAVITRESTLTDEEILEEAIKIDDDRVQDIEDEDDEEIVAPNARDVEKSLEILKSLSLFSEQRGGQMQDLINKFETLFFREKVEKRKQVSITSFVKEK